MDQWPSLWAGLRTLLWPGAAGSTPVHFMLRSLLGYDVASNAAACAFISKRRKNYNRSHTVQMNPYLGGTYINVVLLSLVLTEENDAFLSHSPNWWTHGRT